MSFDTTRITFEEAREFAADWYAAWASLDARRILDLYSKDVHFISPSVTLVAGEPSGELTGISALSGYLARVLARFDDLTFEPISLLLGIDGLTMHYRGPHGLVVTETVRLRGGKIVHSNTHYSEPQDPALRAEMRQASVPS